MNIAAIAERIKDYKPHYRRRRRTAVLVPLIEGADGVEVLFEVRALNLRWQPGDVCFPGGHYEERDGILRHTAIRETAEELGIDPHAITILGHLGSFDSSLGMEIHIFVGSINVNIGDLRIDNNEVHECFSVPLEWLASATPITGAVVHGTRPGEGFPKELFARYSEDWQLRRADPVHFYRYGERVIWGLTAEVLLRFL